MGEVIDDFYDSDAPQFKGKSKEKRRQMAIAAKLQADEAIDLKKKSSERKLNTNPGEKPESAKEYRKNSEPLRKHREKFGDLAKEDWQSVNRKDKTDGLSQKAVNAYRKENPGSKLKTAVTKKPSELKKGSKDAKRRSSFCSRMKGMKKRLTSAKTARDPDSRINKALRRWNCN
jgi:hypothetical protein